MQLLFLLVFLLMNVPRTIAADCASHTLYVPRQLSYNPILENALVYNKNNTDTNYLFSIKPIYTQTVGNSLKKYFTINHASCMQVREDGTGDIDSLWLQNISSDPTFYSSTLSFRPTSKSGGAVLFFQAQLPYELSISVDTAVIHVRNNLNMAEGNITNLGTSDFKTVTQALASSTNCFGRVCGSQGKTGLDDLQVKLIQNMYEGERHHADVYGLLGIPTGAGSKARYLFEPLVGSKHAQLGLGANAQAQLYDFECGSLSVQGELKWRYGFKGKETRSFDLKANGQGSRYMLLVNQTDLFTVLPAINTLTFKADVTPRNSLDVYLAAHFEYRAWNFEVGYDYWYRSREDVCLKNCNSVLGIMGVADLLGISQLDPHTASTATISESVAAGTNQMVSDATFIPLTLSDVNAFSGAAPRSMSNSVYGSMSYTFDCPKHPMELGVNVAYEKGRNVNKADTVYGWLNFDLYI